MTPFTSEEITCENGIDHQKITPLWPQANLEAENFMKPLTKTITEGKSWKKYLHQSLCHIPADSCGAK
jgi:hypothetical protein